MCLYFTKIYKNISIVTITSTNHKKSKRDFFGHVLSLSLVDLEINRIKCYLEVLLSKNEKEDICKIANLQHICHQDTHRKTPQIDKDQTFCKQLLAA